MCCVESVCPQSTSLIGIDMCLRENLSTQMSPLLYPLRERNSQVITSKLNLLKTCHLSRGELITLTSERSTGPAELSQARPGVCARAVFLL